MQECRQPERSGVRSANARRALAFCLVVAAISSVGCFSDPTGRPRAAEPPSVIVHGDGEGPLSTGVGAAGVVTVSVKRVDDEGRPSSGPWSFGMPLCLNDPGPGEAAVITGVEEGATIGDGYEYVGALVRTVAPGENTIGSSFGFPPDQVRQHAPAVGFSVTQRCRRGGRRHQELLVGLRAVGKDGGGWEGQSIEYTIGGQRYELTTQGRWVVCGQLMQEFCD